MGPPENMLPGIAGLELVLVQTPRQVVWIGDAEVYPMGLVLTVLLCGRQPAREGVETGSGTWQFGTQFSDGRKAIAHGLGGFARTRGATVIGSASFASASASYSKPPDGPVLRARSGSGSRSAWRQQYWLWPLPPPGELLLACQWPDLEIEFTTATVSVDPLLAAARRSRQMWPEEDLGDSD